MAREKHSGGRTTTWQTASWYRDMTTHSSLGQCNPLAKICTLLLDEKTCRKHRHAEEAKGRWLCHTLAMYKCGASRQTCVGGAQVSCNVEQELLHIKRQRTLLRPTCPESATRAAPNHVKLCRPTETAHRCKRAHTRTYIQALAGPIATALMEDRRSASPCPYSRHETGCRYPRCWP